VLNEDIGEDRWQQRQSFERNAWHCVCVVSSDVKSRGEEIITYRNSPTGAES